MTSEHQKIARDELWRRGIVAPWYLHEHQMPLYDLFSSSGRDIIVPNLSRRFGKSTTCVVYADEQARNKKQDIRFSTAFLTDLEKFILPIFDLVLTSCPLDVLPRYLKSKKTWIYPNGSTIQLIGLDKNPNGIRGNAVDLLIIDEAGFVSSLEPLYKRVIVPATINRNFKIIFSSTPPEEADHFWLELVEIAKQAGTYLERTIEDNTTISQEERERVIEASGGRNSIDVQREYYCVAVRDPKTVIIPEFNEKIHIHPIKAPDFYFPQTVIDFGGSVDFTGIVLGYYDFKRAKYCIINSALVENNTSTEDLLKIVYALEKESFPEGSNIDRVADCFGQARIDLNLRDNFHTRMPKKGKGSVEANINLLSCLLYTSPSPRD